MQACDARLAHLLANSSQLKQPHDWLLLADRHGLQRVVGRCAAAVVSDLITRGTKQRMQGLDALSKKSTQLLFEAAVRAGRSHAAYSMASIHSWKALGDLF